MIVTSKEGFKKSSKRSKELFDALLEYTDGVLTVYHEDGDYIEFSKEETDQLYEFLQLKRTTQA